jgi:hypothetical protein
VPATQGPGHRLGSGLGCWVAWLGRSWVLPALRSEVMLSLVVLDRLQHNYSLILEDHTTDGGVQIRGLGRSKTTQILARL